MNDPTGKSASDRPTHRPAHRTDERDLPASNRSAEQQEPAKTETLDIEEMEEILPLLEDAERGLDEVRNLERANLAPLKSGRPPEEPPRQLPTIGTFGPYAIVGRLALGGMAEILLAREDSPGAGSRYLVVKRILAEYEQDAAFVEMFLDEARIMMRLRHPNVTHVYKFGKQDETHYIAMEWVQGASLGKLIRRARKSGGIPPQIACKIMSRVAEALDHAHEATGEDGQPLGIVHRDVTPDNIMISYDGAVKLLDFGIARAATRAHKTQAGVVKGKFAYMAPEQCRAKDLDHRVDIFAMGICLYESLTGRPLYRRETEFETMEAIVRGAIPKLSDRIRNAPEPLEDIISTCLAKKRDDRFENAAAFQEALDTWVASCGKVVTARKVKKMMSKLFAEELRRGPTVDTTPFGSSFHMGSDASAAALFSMHSTGDGDALPDLPVPDLPGLEVNATPPYQPDPNDNAMPGVAPTLSSEAGASLLQPDPLGPVPAHHLARDRRPAPTAPGRPIRPPPREEGANVWKWGVLGALAIAVAGGVAYVALGGMLAGGEETRPLDVEPAALLGTLSVDSTPPGAIVFVDDEERGTTPVVVPELTTGRHTVRLVLEGHETHTGTVEIRADETHDLTQPLTPVTTGQEGPTETGRLTLTSTPTATVYLNGRELGTTPLRNVEVPAGLIALELETPDGERHRRGVMVPANDSVSSHIDLTR